MSDWTLPFLWIANGFLALLWLTVDHLWVILLSGALGIAVLQAPAQQRTWMLGVAALSLAAGVAAPFPAALLLLVITLAALANFPQSQTRAPDLRWIEWYLEFVTRRAKNILALLGHPDPRASKRGLGADGNLPDYAEDDLAEEQNEILFRGLAKLRKDFVFQITAEHIDRQRLSRTLVEVARVASNFASRRRGSVNIGFSLGIPLMAALTWRSPKTDRRCMSRWRPGRACMTPTPSGA